MENRFSAYRGLVGRTNS